MTKQNKDKICKQSTIAQKNIAIIDDENKKNINLNKNLNKKIILASGSQGRLEILQKMFIKPDYIIVPNIPEPIIVTFMVFSFQCLPFACCFHMHLVWGCNILLILNSQASILV